MKTLCHLFLIGIMNFAPIVQAGSAPHCWLLNIGLVGVSQTRLQFFGFDKEAQPKKKNKKYLVSGTASFDIITFPLFTRTRVITGSATTLENKIKILHPTSEWHTPSGSN